jgi:glycerol-3-phosphate dehydrogenase
MNLNFEGIEVYFNSWIEKERVIKTDNNQIIMHPYTGACMMLETTSYTYKNVFETLGVTNSAIDACCDSALRLIKTKIDNM